MAVRTKSTREITPHKGGREARLYLRVTPALKERIERAARWSGVGVSDWVNAVLDNEAAAVERGRKPAKKPANR